MKHLPLILLLALSGCAHPVYRIAPEQVSVSAKSVPVGQSTIALGYSMAPAILPFEVLLQDHKPWSELQKGDVAVFWYGEKRIMHRLVKRVEGGWVSQGDNNRYVDDRLVTEDSYLFCVIENN